MMASLKTELRKLLTTRSTYVIIGFVLCLLVLFAFYIEGYRADPAAGQDPNRLAGEVTEAIASTFGFLAIIGLLLVTHEYRYNMIMYTLTASNSRTRTLFAKWFVVSCFAILATLVLGVLSPALTYFGMQLKGIELVPQTINVVNLLWRCLFYGWAFASAGVLVAVLIRNQVGAIITFLFGIGVVEGLLGLLLKHNSVYLPFSALTQVLSSSVPPDAAEKSIGYISPGKAALVFMVYLVVGWIIAWILFLKRDAN